MAILGPVLLSSFRVLDNSDSRPWNILGFDGNIEIEIELEII
jgi:hypothetical protein